MLNIPYKLKKDHAQSAQVQFATLSLFIDTIGIGIRKDLIYVDSDVCGIGPLDCIITAIPRFFCFGSFICNPLHAARRAMAAVVPLPLTEQRRAFLNNLFPTPGQLAPS